MKNNINLKKSLASFLSVLISFAVVYSSGAAVMAASPNNKATSTAKIESSPSKLGKAWDWVKKNADKLIIGLSVGVSAIAIISIVVTEAKKNKELEADRIGKKNDLKDEKIKKLEENNAEKNKEIKNLKQEKEDLERENRRVTILGTLKNNKSVLGRVKNVFKQKTDQDYEEKVQAIMECYNNNKQNKNNFEANLRAIEKNENRRNALVNALFK